MDRTLNAARNIGAVVALSIGCSAALSPRVEALPVPRVVEETLGAQDCRAEIAPPTDAAPLACGKDADAAAAADRAYLLETAAPGYTMTLQGPDVAIGRLHPEFVHRLAGAIREARATGLPSAGIFSAYRPPVFGVGGFSDKFNSLHSYGLAVDMTGIGGPGSADAKTWYEIASRHGVICPYGFENRVEWNHCQPTWLKIIRTENPLRETVTAAGPVNLESMFEAGSAIINHPFDHPNIEIGSTAVSQTEASDKDERSWHRTECRIGSAFGCRNAREAATAHPHMLAALQAAKARPRCKDEARPHEKECTELRGNQTAERRAMHARQAADRGTRESHRV